MENDDDDDENTIIISNLRENGSENSKELNKEFISSKIRTRGKFSSEQVVEPVERVRCISSVPTTYQRGQIEVPPMSFAEDSAQCVASVVNNSQRTEV